MTSDATKARKGEEIHQAGVNAAALLLHEVKGIEKVVGNRQPSTRVSLALQCVLIAAAEAGADANTMLNAVADVSGWMLASVHGGPSAERWATFSQLQAQISSAADVHANARHLGNLETEGTA